MVVVGLAESLAAVALAAVAWLTDGTRTPRGSKRVKAGREPRGAGDRLTARARRLVGDRRRDWPRPA